MTPDTGALREVFLNLFAYIACFILNNKCDKSAIDLIVEIIANSDIRNEFSDVQILNAIKNVYNVCETLQKDFPNFKTDIKPCIKDENQLIYSKIISKGEQLLKNKQRYVNRKTNYFKDILFFVLKSVISSYFILKDYKIKTDDVEFSILDTIIKLESRDVSFAELKKHTEKLAELNLNLYDEIYKCAVETFGVPKKTTVNTSTFEGKAILMTGTSLHELKNLLDASKDKNIDIYTNGNLLVAHSFPLFKSYPNLKGHFANSTENTILDFATFPGAVVLAQWEYQNIGNLYQGKFFSTNKYIPNGICHTESDFSEAIENSLNSAGFVNSNKRQPITTGIDYKNLDKILDDINEKLNSGELKKIVFIGLGTLLKEQKDYFDEFFRLIDDETYVISFSHISNIKNILNLNVANNYPILLNVLRHIFKKLPPSDERMYFFVLRCDPNSLSTVINLKMSGVKNMFYWNCPPVTVNPSVIKVFRKIYNLSETSTAQNDFKFTK